MTKTSSEATVKGVATLTSGKKVRGEWTTAQLAARKDLKSFQMDPIPASRVKAVAAGQAQAATANLTQERSDSLMAPQYGFNHPRFGQRNEWEGTGPTNSWVVAAVQGRPLGEEARRINAAMGLPERDVNGDIVCPLPPRWFLTEAELEERGLLVQAVDAPTTTTTFAPDSVMGPDVFGTVYPLPALVRLGVLMRSVGWGLDRIGYVTGTVNAADRTEGVVTETEEVTVSEIDVEPVRVDAAAEVTVEKMARYQGSADVVQMELTMAVMSRLEKRVLLAINNELSGTAIADRVTRDDDAATFGAVAAIASAAVEGKYAGTEDDIRILCAPRFHGYAAELYTANGEYSALERLRSRSGALVNTEYWTTHGDKDATGGGAGRWSDVMLFTDRGLDAVRSSAWMGVSIGVDNVTRRGAGTIMWACALHGVNVEADSAGPRAGAIVRHEVCTTSVS